MKANRTIFAALAIVGFVCLATAQQSSPVTLTHLEKADQLIGMVVTDSRNVPVGRLNDMAVDLQAGRVAEMLVDTGGLLSSGQRVVAVPPQCLTFSDSGAELRLNADTASFNGAPAFDVSTWSDVAAQSGFADVYKRFHVQPYSDIGRLELATKLTGRHALNQRDQHLGNIDAIVVDLPSGMIPDLIVISTGFLGIKGNLTAIPPQAFLLEPDGALILDTTRELLRAAPHFKRDDWRNGINNPINSSAVYDTFQVLHSMVSDETSSASPDTPVVNPSNDTESQGDAVISSKIEEKIMAAESLSMDARRVQVITHKGRVTLRGIVDSAKEKQRLASIAASVVPVDHVDNELVVKVIAYNTAD